MVQIVFYVVQKLNIYGGHELEEEERVCINCTVQSTSTDWLDVEIGHLPAYGNCVILGEKLL